MELKLKEIIESLDNSSGQLFFDKIVLNLAAAISVDYVFIAKLDKNKHTSTTISLAAKGAIVDNFEYDLKYTPCDDVSSDKVCCFTEKITELYPKDQLLIDMNIEAYIGSPLYDSTGKVVGLLVALSEQPVKDPDLVTTLFKLFSGRIAVELERCYLELANTKNIEKLKSINKSLEVKVEKQVQEKLLQEKYMLQQSRLAQMGEMISMIAHQWRQPLSAISTTSMDLQMKLMLNSYDMENKEEREEFLSYLNSSLKSIDSFVNNLSITIDDFRSFYKPNKEKAETTLEKVVSKALSIIKDSLESQSVKLTFDYQSKNRLKLYENEIMQTILNILKNSQDCFLEKKIDNPQINIKTKGNSIAICDNAGGIPADIIDKIFDPYFSTKYEKNGTGLGLYMSKMIIEEHHGGVFSVANINDVNGVNTGVCFTIELNNS